MGIGAKVRRGNRVGEMGELDVKEKIERKGGRRIPRVANGGGVGIER